MTNRLDPPFSDILLDRWPRIGAGSWFALLVVSVAISFVTGCRRPDPAPVAAKPPEVFVAHPVAQDFTEFEDFPGSIVSTDMIEVRARVDGYLDKTPFKDGADVKEGDVLFEIDPRPYQAEVERAIAEVAQNKAKIERIENQLERGLRLIKERAVSQEKIDLLKIDRADAEAALHAAEARRKLAELNLGFTKVRSPVTGRVSRRLVDPGNLVKADDTLLATVVALDPVYAYFDVNELTVLRVRRLAQSRSGPAPSGLGAEVTLSLADRNDFAIRGTIVFVDNQFDTDTGTLRMRARVDNPRLLLTPGMFVRCRFPIGEPKKALFVAEEALGSDQGQPFLYVVDANDKVVYRKVDTGPLLSGRRVVLSNLASSDRVVVRGLQRIRPGDKVVPQSADPKSTPVASEPIVSPTKVSR